MTYAQAKKLAERLRSIPFGRWTLGDVEQLLKAVAILQDRLEALVKVNQELKGVK